MACSVRAFTGPAAASVVENSCLINSELDEIARDVGIDRNRVGSGTSLLAKLHEHFGTQPGQEDTWINRINNRELARKLERTAFRPLHPSSWTTNPREWLSDEDITLVLSQYEMHLKDTHRFKFVGVFPSDFAAPRHPEEGAASVCVSPAMCQLNVKDLTDSGIHNIGMVFNLDEHDQSGSHWVACYISLDPTNSKRYGASFYDSVGKPPLPSISDFMQRMKTEAEEHIGILFPVRINKVKKQKLNTECGVYALIFIILCLQTKLAFSQICKKSIKGDDKTHKLRWVMFRTPS